MVGGVCDDRGMSTNNTKTVIDLVPPWRGTRPTTSPGHAHRFNLRMYDTAVVHQRSTDKRFGAGWWAPTVNGGKPREYERFDTFDEAMGWITERGFDMILGSEHVRRFVAGEEIDLASGRFVGDLP